MSYWLWLMCESAEHEVAEPIRVGTTTLAWDIIARRTLLRTNPVNACRHYAWVNFSVCNTQCRWIELSPIRSTTEIASHPREGISSNIAGIVLGKTFELCTRSRLHGCPHMIECTLHEQQHLRNTLL